MSKVVLNEQDIERLKSGESIDSILSSRGRKGIRDRARELSPRIISSIKSMNLDEEGKEWLLKAWNEYCSKGCKKEKKETPENEGKQIFYSKLKEFLSIAEKAKQFNPETKLPYGIYPDELRKELGDKFVEWLVQHHYISLNKGKQVWFAYTNKKYPGNTISKLYTELWEYENL